MHPQTTPGPLLEARIFSDAGMPPAAPDHDLEALLNALPDEAWLKDADGRYRMFNEPFLRARGLARAAVVGRTDAELFSDHLASAFAASDTDVMRTRHRLTREDSVLVEGEVRWYETVKTPLLGTEGEVRGVVGVARDVTDRKRMEQRLRESEVRFRAIFEHAAHGIVFGEVGSAELHANPAAQRFLDLSEWARREHVADRTHPDDYPVDMELLQELLAGKRDHYQLEKRYVRPSGETVWGSLTVSAIRDAEGRTTAAVSMIRDISSRKRAEAELRDREALLRGIVEGTLDAVFVTDLRGRFTLVNTAAAELAGLESDQILGRTPVELFPPTVADVVMDAHARVVDSGRAVVMEHPVRLRRGESGFYRITCTPLRSAEGEVVGVIGTAHDVTHRHRSEAVLRRSEARAQRQAERMRAVAAVAAGVPRARSTMELNEVIREGCKRVLDHDVLTLGLYDEANGVLRFLGGWDGDVYEPSHVVPLAGTPSERVFRERRSLLTLSAADPAGQGATIIGTGRRSQSIIRTPILSGDRVLGLLAVQSYTPDLYTPEDVEVLEAFAATAATALRNIELLTEQQAAHRALEESEESYRSVFNSLTELVYLLDREGRYVNANEAVVRTYGYTLEELAGQPALLLVDLEREDAEEIGRRLERAVSGESQSFEIWGRRKDGSVFPKELVANPGRYFGQDVLVVVARDISERKAAEDALRERERQLAEAQAIAHVGSWEWDLSRDTITWSDEHFRLFGLEPQSVSMTFARYQQFLHPDDCDKLRSLLAESLRTGSDFEAEHRVFGSDGELRHVLGRGRVIHDAEGTPVRMVGTAQDITDRRAADAALREEEERFRTVVEALGEGILITDLEDRILYANARAGEIFGYVPSEMVGQRGLDLLLAPEDREVLLRQNARRGEGMLDRYEARQLRSDGKFIWTEITGSPLRDGTGVVIGTVGAITDITERRHTVQLLQESEARYRLVSGTTNDAIWEFDPKTDRLEWNDTFATVFGGGASTLAEWSERIHPDDREATSNSFDRALEAAAPVWTAEYRFLRTDGSYADVLDRARILYGEAGDVLRIVGAMMDISDQKRAQAKLRAAEAELRAIFAAMQDVVLVLDREGRYLKVAPTDPNLLYRPTDELVGKTVGEVLPRETADAVTAVVGEVLDRREMVRTEYSLSIGTEEVWFSAAVSPMTDDTVLWVARDMTERRRQEQALHRADLILESVGKAAERFLHRADWAQGVEEMLRDLGTAGGVSRVYLFQAEPDAKGEVWFRQRFEWVAAGVTRQIDNHEVALIPMRAVGLGRWVDAFSRGIPVHGPVCEMPPEERPSLEAQEIVSMAAVPVWTGDEWWGAIGCDDCQSERIWSSAEMDALRAAAGLIGAAIHRRRMDDELVRAKEQAEQASRAKSQFLANMSHELRTPLNSVIGFSDVLLTSWEGDSHGDNALYLSRILDNGKHLLSLINDVLDLSKVEAGKVEVLLSEIDLRELVRGTVQGVNSGRAGSDVQLLLELPATPVMLHTDAPKLRQVLTNLVGNALKFTERGTVTVALETHDAMLEPLAIHVRDTGIGIPADRIEAIFGAFEQAEGGTSRRYGGTGLGLSISRSLCRLMGYRLDVRSEAGAGSTFTIHFRD